MLSILETPGGGFWNTYSFDKYIIGLTATGPAQIMSKIDNFLHDGDSIALTIIGGNLIPNHAISLWGFDYESDDKGNITYTDVYVTDSDDNYIGLKRYGLNFYNNKYYLDNFIYNNSKNWYLGSAVALKKAPFSSAKQVPEPSLILLFCIGLFSIAGIKAGIKKK
ncbi:IdeS/Mac family cysteine endopeptidase [Desulfobacterium sp. N47]|uniref:Ig protease IdeS domain-containing protein n=1 Tax=uncultured Desulfobacterium sp. TaxID=201089 RepID=E1YJC1_9BACT|nr:unknown protein [uncultured Desulfobacterium sp.]